MSDILKDPVALSGLRGKVIEEIRAWCEERGLETYIWIKVDEHCAVDRRFVNEHRVICLDISTDAVDVVEIVDGWIAFRCNFQDAPNSLVCAPLTRVLQVGPADDPSQGVRFFEKATAPEFRDTCPYPAAVYGTEGVVKRFRPHRRNS